MNQLLIRNANIITPFNVFREADILIENGKIKTIGTVLTCSGCKSIDAEKRYVTPGFIDLHLHGGGGLCFMDGSADDFIGIAQTHARFGTTTLLPTTLACTDDELEHFFTVYQEAVQRDHQGANMPGVHLEGPYFSYEQKGAQDPKFIRDPDPAHYGPILERWGKLIRRWSSAPELAGTEAFAAALRQYDILPTAGHSDAFYEDIEKAYTYGYTHLTHLYSGMSGLRRINGIRRPGIIESAYISDDLTVEVIADGMHIPPSILKQVYKGIGPARTALITDAMRAAGTDVKTSVLGSMKNGQKVWIEDGVAWMEDRMAFAGSICTMDRTVRTYYHQVGISLIDAVRMATDTPARIAGFASKGRIAPGFDADLVIFDEKIKIYTTIINGKICYQSD